MRTVLGLVVCGTLMLAAPLRAQERRAWPERVVLSVNVPFQVLNNEFAESLSVADALRATENVTFDATYGSTRGVLVDAGAGVRLTGNLGVGITVSHTARAASSGFDLEIPDPTVASSPLRLAGTVADLDRRELAVHVQALYAVGLSPDVRVLLAAGPSIIDARQDLIRSIDFFIRPGFAGLDFDQALLGRDSDTAVGFHVSADITWAVTPHIGIGIVTRYSRATLTLDPGSASGLNRDIATVAGGLHVGAGIRLLF